MTPEDILWFRHNYLGDKKPCECKHSYKWHVPKSRNCVATIGIDELGNDVNCTCNEYKPKKI